MVLRTSNRVFLGVLSPVPLINTGWEVQIYDRNNFNLLLAVVPRWQALKLQIPLSDIGMGSLTIDLDDSIFTAPLPAGVSGDLLANENLVKCYFNGVLRQQFFMEEYKEGHVDGSEVRTLAISGRASAKVAEEATVLPPGYPAFTAKDHTWTTTPVMKAWRDLLAEAQARGALPFVSTLFSDTGDTASVSWTDSSNLSVPPGGDLLQLLQRFRDAANVEWVMNTNFQLDARVNYGYHREDKVRFQVSADQLEYTISRSRRSIRNVILAEGGDGGISQAIDSGSAAQWRRREAYVTAGDAKDAATRGTFAAATLFQQKDEGVQVTLKVAHDGATRTLWVDYDLGDYIGVDAQDARASGNYKVIALNIDVDDAGNTNLELTLQTKLEEAIIKLQRLMGRLGGNTSVGASGQTIVSGSSTVSNSRLDDLSDVNASPTTGQALVWNVAGYWSAGTVNLSGLADVNPAGIGDGRALRWDATASKWVTYAAAVIGDHTWSKGSSSSPLDDEFNTGVLGGTWVRLDVPSSAHATWSVGADVLSVLHTGTDTAGNMHALLKSIGAFAIGNTIETAVIYNGPNQASPLAGLVLSSTNVGGTGVQVVGVYWNSTAAPYRNCGIRRMTGFNTDVASVDVALGGGMGSRVFLRLKWVAANSFQFSYSADGVSWITQAAQAYTVTPAFMGLVVSSEAATGDFAYSFEYFRVI